MPRSRGEVMGRVASCIAVLLVAACMGGGTNPLTGEPGSDSGFRLNLDIVLPPDEGPPDAILTPPSSDVGVVPPDVVDRRGHRCAENAECGPGGWCVPGPDGRVCTITCVDTCPDDWACAGVEGLGSDLIFLCLPREPAVCIGCVRAEDCPSPTVCADLRSDEAVIGQGACMLPCESEGATCAPGFECVPRRRVDGAVELVCAPDADTGCCSTVTRDSVEACALQNEHGRCWGSRRCNGVDGWGLCEAQLPAAEICDGTDNDCDGSFDEELPELCACGDGDCVGAWTSSRGRPWATHPRSWPGTS